VQVLKRTNIRARKRLGTCEWCSAGNQERYWISIQDRKQLPMTVTYIILVCRECVSIQPWYKMDISLLRKLRAKFGIRNRITKKR